MTRWLPGRPASRHGKAWYSEYAICPLDGAFTSARYHDPDTACESPAQGTHHNHMRCRCGYEWTLPPREGDH